MCFTRGKQINHVLLAVYFGYSKEGMVTGFRRRMMLDSSERDLDIPTSYQTPFYGTGYIPTPEDIERGYEVVVAEINQRRHAPFGFNQPEPDNADELMNEWLYVSRGSGPNATIREYFECLRERGLMKITDTLIERILL